MTEFQIPKQAKDAGAIEWHPTGSFYICNPSITDTDRDWIVYVYDAEKFAKRLGQEVDDQIEEGESCSDSPDFISLRILENANLIVTEKPWFYKKFVLATEVAKRMNLRNKSDRILLFDAIIFGNDKAKWKSEAVPGDELILF